MRKRVTQGLSFVLMLFKSSRYYHDLDSLGIGPLCAFQGRHERVVKVKETIQHPVLGVKEVVVGVVVVRRHAHHAVLGR